MFEVLDQSNATCLAVHFSGKVTGEEYQHFLDALTERLKTGRQVSLVLELAGFEFYGDFETARKDFKFGFGEYKRIHRAALVGDQKWIEWFTRLIGPSHEWRRSITLKARSKRLSAGHVHDPVIGELVGFCTILGL